MATPDNLRESLGTRAFRAVLGLYPAAFRDEYHRELMLLFVDRYRHASGRWDRLHLWLEALGGVLAEAPKEHARMVLQDVRYALRVWRQRPFVTATIVITLALGIGANTAMFSLLNTIVLRTLPVPNPEQLYAVRAVPPVAVGTSRFSGPMFERLRGRVPDGTSLAAMSRVARVYTRLDHDREVVPAALQLISADYFRVLAVTPLLGAFAPVGTTAAQTASAAALVSYDYWQRRLGGTSDVVGRPLTINGATFTVVGVGPRGFTGVWLESPVDIWVPLAMQSALKYSQNYSMDRADQNRPWIEQERVWWLDVIVRTPQGKASAVAGALNASVADVARAAPPITLEEFARGSSTFRQRFSTPLFALIGMASLVMLIACANVANLLLAQAARRQREMAVRMSVGAGRARLLHQLLTEGTLLVTVATAAALLLAGWVGDFLVRTATANLDGRAPFAAHVDLRVMAFTALVAFASVLLFGLVPAWRASRVDLIAALNAGGRGAAGSSARPARVLVVLQVALSLVLVTATGLFVRGFQQLLDLDLGFDRSHLLSVTIDPRLIQTRQQNLPELHQRLLDAVRTVPNVRSAALAMCGLQSGCRAREDGMLVEGYRARADEEIVFSVNMVSADYFSTTGMRLIAGRMLEERDASGGTRVAVVNKVLATKYFADGQAVGRHFGENALDVEIVGIVDDARAFNIKEPAAPSVFFSLTQRPVAARQLEVRTSGDPRLAAAAVRKAIADIAPDLPIERIVTMDQRVLEGLSQERLIVSLTSGFGALALGLAGFGLFGLLSYAVAQRTSEFGVRMALGASRRSVLWGVVREALWLVVLGCLVGLPAVLAGGDLVSKVFVGVGPRDWSIFATATAILIGVGCACSALPALRASRVDPIVALRDE